MSHSALWKLSVKQLGNNLAEAVELAQVLREAVPHIRVVDQSCEQGLQAAPSSAGSTPRHWSAKERLHKASACLPIGARLPAPSRRASGPAAAARRPPPPACSPQTKAASTGASSGSSSPRRTSGPRTRPSQTPR
jgi:hypothetical protein